SSHQPLVFGVELAIVTMQPPDEEFADFACAPMRLLALERQDQAFDLRGQLVSVADRPPATIGEGLEPVLFVAIEDLVTGFSRDAELATDVGHRFAVQQSRHEPKALFHHRTLLPGHRHLPHRSAECYPCVRYVLSPMSRAAHHHHPNVRYRLRSCA